jgi:hypothetical protein
MPGSERRRGGDRRQAPHVQGMAPRQTMDLRAGSDRRTRRNGARVPMTGPLPSAVRDWLVVRIGA